MVFGILITGGLFLIFTYFFGKNESYAAKNSLTAADGTTLESLAQIDSNENGIADWEEALWGLDPHGDGADNKKIIDEKKTLAKSKDGTDSEPAAPLNETDAFARDFIVTVSSLKTSGNLSDDTLAGLSKDLSNEIGSKQYLSDKYTKDTITVVPETPESRKLYAEKVTQILNTYSAGIGDELSYLEDYFTTEDVSDMQKLKDVGTEYKNISSQIASLSVPASNTEVHLALINSFEKMGTAVNNLSEMDGNTLTGMVGMAQYENFNQEASDAIIKMQVYFQ